MGEVGHGNAPGSGSTGGNDGGGDGGSGSGDGSCFLTTAVVEMRGEPDDGPTLSTLRRFRDEHMLATARGRERVREYYAVTPGIVAKIQNGDPIWDWIAGEVDACVKTIEEGDHEEAEKRYTKMVRRLTQDTEGKR